MGHLFKRPKADERLSPMAWPRVSVRAADSIATPAAAATKAGREREQSGAAREFKGRKRRDVGHRARDQQVEDKHEEGSTVRAVQVVYPALSPMSTGPATSRQTMQLMTRPMPSQMLCARAGAQRVSGQAHPGFRTFKCLNSGRRGISGLCLPAACACRRMGCIRLNAIKIATCAASRRRPVDSALISAMFVGSSGLHSPGSRPCPLPCPLLCPRPCPSFRARLITGTRRSSG